MSWNEEFPAEYAPPPEVAALVNTGELEDYAWHNDVNPKFGRRNETTGAEVFIFCAPENRADREDPEMSRFYILVDVGEEMDQQETDDVSEAIALWRAAWAKHGDQVAAPTDNRPLGWNRSRLPSEPSTADGDPGRAPAPAPTGAQQVTIEFSLTVEQAMNLRAFLQSARTASTGPLGDMLGWVDQAVMVAIRDGHSKGAKS